MPDIICIGEPLFELNQPRGEDIFRKGHGGDTSNCAIAAARQGASVAYVTAVGADQFGNSFLELWKQEGVDTSAVRRSPIAHTGLYFVTHGPDGHVFSYMRAGSAASRITPGRHARGDDQGRAGRSTPPASARRSRRAPPTPSSWRCGMARAAGRPRLLRHQPPPPPLAARPGPRGDPRRCVTGRHRAPRSRRRDAPHRPHRAARDRRLLPGDGGEDRCPHARRRRRADRDARAARAARAGQGRSWSTRPAPATCSTALSSPNISAPAIPSPPAATPMSPRRCRRKATARSRRCRAATRSRRRSGPGAAARFTPAAAPAAGPSRPAPPRRGNPDR